MNDNLQTVIVAPMTTKSHDYPSRIKVDFQNKTGWIVLDQMKTIDKSRLTRKLGEVDKKTVQKVKSVIKEMLVD
jgi:mRNA interferase MazF